VVLLAKRHWTGKGDVSMCAKLEDLVVYDREIGILTSLSLSEHLIVF
jgi:hypothetical protein